MALRMVRVGAGALLGASGALMYAASWQRWAGACGWGDLDGARCSVRQDHRYDFLAPTAPWEPLGAAAQLAGWSLLISALAFALLPWALIGRRPGVVSTVALVGAVLGTAVMGIANIRAGVTGSVVDPRAVAVAGLGWGLLVPALVVRFAISSRGWALVAAGCLLLATPLVALFSYAIGPYDAQPWWEAISAIFTALSGLCLLVAAAFGVQTRQRAPTSASRANQTVRIVH